MKQALASKAANLGNSDVAFAASRDAYINPIDFLLILVYQASNLDSHPHSRSQPAIQQAGSLVQSSPLPPSTTKPSFPHKAIEMHFSLITLITTFTVLATALPQSPAASSGSPAPVNQCSQDQVTACCEKDGFLGLINLSCTAFSRELPLWFPSSTLLIPTTQNHRISLLSYHPPLLPMLSPLSLTLIWPGEDSLLTQSSSI